MLPAVANIVLFFVICMSWATFNNTYCADFHQWVRPERQRFDVYADLKAEARYLLMKEDSGELENMLTLFSQTSLMSEFLAEQVFYSS